MAALCLGSETDPAEQARLSGAVEAARRQMADLLG
jgi:hypothetical protein